jgi:hypothetical protein
MSSSILLRPGYFSTLIFASALTGSAALPVIMPELFWLPVYAGLAILLAGIVAGMSVLFRWPKARLLAMVYLVVLMAVSAWFAFTGPPLARISWGILGTVVATLLATLLLSGTIRKYEAWIHEQQ